MPTTTTAPAFYITVTKGDQYAELVGPFKSENDANSELEIVSERVRERLPEECEGATFAVSVGKPSPHGLLRGTKNKVLGYRSDPSGRIVRR
jgi:hypothetical protein